MKYLIILFTFIFLLSCKTSKNSNCDAYGKVNSVKTNIKTTK
jgi:hypothetical protein